MVKRGPQWLLGFLDLKSENNSHKKRKDPNILESESIKISLLVLIIDILRRGCLSKEFRLIALFLFVFTMESEKDIFDLYACRNMVYLLHLITK